MHGKIKTTVTAAFLAVACMSALCACGSSAQNETEKPEEEIIAESVLAEDLNTLTEPGEPENTPEYWKSVYPDLTLASFYITDPEGVTHTYYFSASGVTTALEWCSQEFNTDGWYFCDNLMMSPDGSYAAEGLVEDSLLEDGAVYRSVTEDDAELFDYKRIYTESELAEFGAEIESEIDPEEIETELPLDITAEELAALESVELSEEEGSGIAAGSQETDKEDSGSTDSSLYSQGLSDSEHMAVPETSEDQMGGAMRLPDEESGSEKESTGTENAAGSEYSISVSE